MSYQSTSSPVASVDQSALSQPLYGATFGQAFSRFWKKYATFSGRASRSEFWWWYLANAIITTVLWIVMAMGGFSGATYDAATATTAPGPLFVVGVIVMSLWYLAILVPTLALSWRRLHDTNRSGGFWFLGFIPIVGGIILLVLFVLPSDPAGARFDA